MSLYVSYHYAILLAISYIDHDLRSVVAAVTAKRVEDRTEDATKKTFTELNDTADDLVGPLKSGSHR